MEGKFTRWQSITITQLGYAINLVLSFATASLGFSLSLARDSRNLTSCWGRHLLLIAIAIFMFSIGLGLWCVINRLRDFRKTKDIARDVEQGKLTPAEHERRNAETQRLGESTWLMFWWQIGLFAIGLLSLVAAFLFVYHANLF